MFAVTYLGQQGWLVEGQRGRVLVDPLLTAEYSPGFDATIYPPRTIDHGKLPPIDAVILSHEHADHLNLPSLALLDRRIPIALPARSSQPIADVLAGLGFRVVRTHPDDHVRIGDLDLHFLGDDLQHDAELESEWTVLQLLVSSPSGSFFSYGDGWPSEATRARIHELVGGIGIFSHANNTMDWSCLEATVGPSGWPHTTLDYAAGVIEAEASWWRGTTPPAVSLICGPGIAFRGADAWLNQILCADSATVCSALETLAPTRRFHAPLPGDQMRMDRGTLREIRRAPFVRVPPRNRWPSLKVRDHRELVEDYEPSCGTRTVDVKATAALEQLLARFASYLHRRSLFRAIVSLDRTKLGKRRAAFALLLRCDDDDSALVYEYEPQACRFVQVRSRDPIQTYAAGLECWASDLVAFARGAQLPQRLLGHMRTWSVAPTLPVLGSIWGFFDLVYHPDAASAFYRAVADRVRDLPQTIAAGRHVRALR